MKGPVQMKFSANRSTLTIILITSILFVGCSKKQAPASNTTSEEKPAAKAPAENVPATAEPAKLVLKADAKGKDERKDPDGDLKKLFDEYFAAVSSSATIEQTRRIAEKVIESNNYVMINQLAWDIMMEKNIDDAKRDYEIAIKAAAIANTIAKGKNGAILDTYAMALYKTGKIEEAIAAQQKAFDLAPGCMRSKFKARLEIYKK
jgi:tetratricopeptide (TPR) repeat protein